MLEPALDVTKIFVTNVTLLTHLSAFYADLEPLLLKDVANYVQPTVQTALLEQTHQYAFNALQAMSWTLQTIKLDAYLVDLAADLALTKYAWNAKVAHIWNGLMELVSNVNKAALHALVSKLVQHMKNVWS